MKRDQQGKLFFPEPVWCFLKNIKRKGGQLTENISRATQKDLCKPLENETESCVRKDLKKDLKKELKKELKEYRSQGIPLYLNGKPSSPKSIAKACQIAEGGGYMRDYVEDEKGRIARVDFDFIENR